MKIISMSIFDGILGKKKKLSEAKKDEYSEIKKAFASEDKCAECKKTIGSLFEDERIYLNAGGTEIKLCPSCHALYTTQKIPTIIKRVLTHDEITKLIEVEEMYSGKGYEAYKLRTMMTASDTFNLVIINEDRNLYYTDWTPVEATVLDHASEAIGIIERSDIKVPKNMTLAEYAAPKKIARNAFVEASVDGSTMHAHAARKVLEIYELSEPLVDRIARIGRCL
jgi:mRNA-degrading endonuclease HigB of HigAB toxin-antitoxin module